MGDSCVHHPANEKNIRSATSLSCSRESSHTRSRVDSRLQSADVAFPSSSNRILEPARIDSERHNTKNLAAGMKSKTTNDGRKRRLGHSPERVPFPLTDGPCKTASNDQNRRTGHVQPHRSEAQSVSQRKRKGPNTDTGKGLSSLPPRKRMFGSSHRSKRDQLQQFHLSPSSTCFALVEGIVPDHKTDYLREVLMNGRSDCLPSSGRMIELPLEAMGGTWSAQVAHQNSSSLLLRESMKCIRIQLRHQTATAVGELKVIRHHKTSPPPPTPIETTKLSICDLEVFRIYPWQNRSVEPVNGDKDSSSESFVGSLSIAGFEGFSSSSDNIERSHRLASNLLASCKRAVGDGNIAGFNELIPVPPFSSTRRLSPPQESEQECLAAPKPRASGISFICSIDLEESYYLLIGRSRSDKIAAIDVVFETTTSPSSSSCQSSSVGSLTNKKKESCPGPKLLSAQQLGELRVRDTTSPEDPIARVFGTGEEYSSSNSTTVDPVTDTLTGRKAISSSKGPVGEESKTVKEKGEPKTTAPEQHPEPTAHAPVLVPKNTNRSSGAQDRKNDLAATAVGLISEEEQKIAETDICSDSSSDLFADCHYYHSKSKSIVASSSNRSNIWRRSNPSGISSAAALPERTVLQSSSSSSSSELFPVFPTRKKAPKHSSVNKELGNHRKGANRGPTKPSAATKRTVENRNTAVTDLCSDSSSDLSSVDSHYSSKSTSVVASSNKKSKTCFPSYPDGIVSTVASPKRAVLASSSSSELSPGSPARKKQASRLMSKQEERNLARNLASKGRTESSAVTGNRENTKDATGTECLFSDPPAGKKLESMPASSMPEKPSNSNKNASTGPTKVSASTKETCPSREIARSNDAKNENLFPERLSKKKPTPRPASKDNETRAPHASVSRQMTLNQPSGDFNFAAISSPSRDCPSAEASDEEPRDDFVAVFDDDSPSRGKFSTETSPGSSNAAVIGGFNMEAAAQTFCSEKGGASKTPARHTPSALESATPRVVRNGASGSRNTFFTGMESQRKIPFVTPGSSEAPARGTGLNLQQEVAALSSPVYPVRNLANGFDIGGGNEQKRAFTQEGIPLISSFDHVTTRQNTRSTLKSQPYLRIFSLLLGLFLILPLAEREIQNSLSRREILLANGRGNRRKTSGLSRLKKAGNDWSRNGWLRDQHGAPYTMSEALWGQPFRDGSVPLWLQETDDAQVD